MGIIEVATKAGDIKVEWDPADPESVDKAKAEFAHLKASGYEFFETTEVPDKKKRVKTFRKGLGKVIAVPGVGVKKDQPIKAPSTSPARPAAQRGGPNDPTRAAIERGKIRAREWNLLDPETSIPAEAAKQIVLAGLGL